MRTRLRLLRQLLADGMYVVDEDAVANAIVARAVVRLTVPESPLYNALRGSQSAALTAIRFRSRRPPVRPS